MPTIHRSASYPRQRLGFLDRTQPVADAVFGSLIYVADSLMHPMSDGEGFGMHGHRNVEIVSMVLDGTLTHRDSAGHSGQLGPLSFQCISAGRGIRHEEVNHSARPLRMFQLWFVPTVLDGEPAYADVAAAPLLRDGQFVTILDNGASSPLPLAADGKVAVGRMPAGTATTVATTNGRAAILYLVTGLSELAWPGRTAALERADHVRLGSAEAVELRVSEESLLLLIDVPSAPATVPASLR